MALSARWADAGDDKGGYGTRALLGKAGLGAPQGEVSKEEMRASSAFLIFFPCCSLPSHTLVPKSCHRAFLSRIGKGTDPPDGVVGYAFRNGKGHF